MLLCLQARTMKSFSRSSQHILHRADFVCQTGMRMLSAVEPSVIRIPANMAKKIREHESKKKKSDRERKLKQSQQGSKSVPIISCKRKEFNHYKGQVYNKFQELPIASKGWGHRKSAGDYFTINSYGKNPAFAQFASKTSDFESLGLSKDVLKQITELGFKVPTNIQTLAIPHVLEGKNSLITAETGNGKTLAYLAPMIQQIAMHKNAYEKDSVFNTPMGLIIAPSRELAEQIQTVASALGSDLGIKVELLKGGRTKLKMRFPKMKEVHLLIATIGALSKLTTTGVYNTKLVRHIALDEADTLLDDSFNETMIRYMSRFPIQGVQNDESTHPEERAHPTALSGCQLTLISATMPRSLQTILDPVVDLESLEQISTPYLHCIMPHVPQRFFRINTRTKSEKLLELVKNNKASNTPVIIFSNDSKTTDWVSLFLNENEIPCVNLHGRMGAATREGRFKQFQDGEVLALSCTDLTSRGLDTIGAGHIINFDFPTFISDYIHRCGRTGRVGSCITGIITSLVQRRHEVELVQKIEYAARKTTEFHNVNANIKRALTGKAAKQGDTIN